MLVVNKMKIRFPYIAQYDTMDCGPACLCMIAKYYGHEYSLSYIRRYSYLSKEGVSLLGISAAAEKIGFHTSSFKVTLNDLIEENSTPCILYWNNSHFVVLYNIKRLSDNIYFYISDPAQGKFRLSKADFESCWLDKNDERGVVMLLEPTEMFSSIKMESNSKSFIKYVTNYISAFRKHFVILLFALGVSSLFSLFLPFLTQILIDKGIKFQSKNIVFLVILSQFIIYIGITLMDIVRNWLVLFIGARVNINIISDYLHTILKLHISFFDTKFLDDFYQRIQDHSRIEKFLTSQCLTTFFSLVTLSIYTIVLLKFNASIFILYLSGTTLALCWTFLFIAIRKKLDYFRFKYNALTQDSINEIISGIQDIKLNGFEDYKINKWESIQQAGFENNQKILKTEQIQMIGFDFINQIKTLSISLITAMAVIAGKLTLGEMVSISFIISQIDSPISQLVEFFKSMQDAKLSLNRLIEVQDFQTADSNDRIKENNKMYTGIQLVGVSFQYEDPLSKFVVNNVNILIPKHKITAIVGESGCGKTSLLKLLLKLYDPTKGDIYIDGINLKNIPFEEWRMYCGAVMQDTFIFSESIARNVALSDEKIDYAKIDYALSKACILDFVKALPKGVETIIGSMGNGLSNGQRQRLILARMIYRNPDYIFLDEATSSLDAINEKSIYSNIKEIFKEKTVVIIAHRLSTIRNADQIIVMNDGSVCEYGSHQHLMSIKGQYYKLIQNQI